MLAAHDLPRASYEQPPPAFERALTVPDLTAEVPLIDRLRRATIGRYDIYAELGAGGMATVFLALDLALDRKVAIKVMSPALISSPGAIDRFRREARVAAALSHPHIVPIHAIGGEPGLAYYVMKYIEGRSLDAVLRTEGQRDIAFAQAILGYVGSALHYAHQRGVVHRDVKPANIMLDREGWCYVTDFGIAKAEDSTGLTKSGVVIGTPNYMCPEQFNGQPITGAADQYALGVVAYELLTGEPPFGGPTLGEVMRGHLLEPVPAVRSRRPDIPEALEACVQRMMAKDPADRFPTVADAVAAFGTLSATVEGDARTVIAELARRGEGGPVIAVPTSPVPQHRSTVHADLISAHTRQMTHPGVTPAASTTGVHATPRRRTRAVPLLLAVGAVIAIGAAAWSATIGDASSGATSPQTAGGASPAGPQVERSVASPNGSPGGPAVDSSVGSRARPPAPPPTAAPAPSDPQPERENPPAADDNRQRPGKARDRLADIAARREAAGRPIAAAAVRIGSRIPSAWLYVNDRPIRVIGERGVQLVPVPAGRVRLSIRKDNCQSWDTTFTAIAAERHVIGFRAPTC